MFNPASYFESTHTRISRCIVEKSGQVIIGLDVCVVTLLGFR